MIFQKSLYTVNKENFNRTGELPMYCRTCGNESNENWCSHCNTHPLAGKKFCQACGALSIINQHVCINCWYALKTMSDLPEFGQVEQSMPNELDEIKKIIKLDLEETVTLKKDDLGPIKEIIRRDLEGPSITKKDNLDLEPIKKVI